MLGSKAQHARSHWNPKPANHPAHVHSYKFLPSGRIIVQMTTQKRGKTLVVPSTDCLVILAMSSTRFVDKGELRPTPRPASTTHLLARRRNPVTRMTQKLPLCPDTSITHFQPQHGACTRIGMPQGCPPSAKFHPLATRLQMFDTNDRHSGSSKSRNRLRLIVRAISQRPSRD
jgi:hypothetical protein